jgi:hypothetical protein
MRGSRAKYQVGDVVVWNWHNVGLEWESTVIALFKSRWWIKQQYFLSAPKGWSGSVCRVSEQEILRKVDR